MECTDRWYKVGLVGLKYAIIDANAIPPGRSGFLRDVRVVVGKANRCGHQKAKYEVCFYVAMDEASR